MNLLISSLAVAALLILATVAFEKARPRPRELMPVVVLASLAVLGRVVTMPIPNFQPATALIVLTGLFFGRHAGLLCGMLVALVSNMLLGQGPWTLWQMLAWGLVGYGAGILGSMTKGKALNSSNFSLSFQALVITYGVAASLLFGAFQDLQFFIAYTWEAGWTGLLTTLTLGLPLNLMHAASTLIFLLLVLAPWGRKLHRLRTKYGIRSI